MDVVNKPYEIPSQCPVSLLRLNLGLVCRDGFLGLSSGMLFGL